MASMVLLTAKLGVEFRDRVGILAERRGIPRSAVVRRLIDAAWEKLVAEGELEEEEVENATQGG